MINLNGMTMILKMKVVYIY